MYFSSSTVVAVSTNQACIGIKKIDDRRAIETFWSLSFIPYLNTKMAFARIH